MRTIGPPHRREGYVLLLVLIAMIVATVALTRLAGVTSQLAIDAGSAERALQQRWAERSCAKVLLPKAAGLFAARDEATGRVETELPPAVTGDQLQLGHSVVRIVLADENAKLNLNALYHNTNEMIVERELRRSLSPGAARTLSLRPAVESETTVQKKSGSEPTSDQEDDATGSERFSDAFRSWGEVFDMSDWRRLSGSDRGIAAVAKTITVWGNGRLNVVRASDSTFLSMCRPIVQDGLARRIVDRFRSRKNAEIRLVVEREVTNPRDRKRLLDMLGEQSLCFSIWVETETRQERQRFFSVIESDGEGVFRTIPFKM